MVTTPSPNATPANLAPMIIDHDALRDTFKQDIIDGLSRRPKATPPKHLYDARGSAIFEDICEAEEYYPTRTEAKIFDDCLDDIADAIGPEAVLIEPGAGSGEKAERFLEALESVTHFVPVEISQDALHESSVRIAQRFPSVQVHPICADFNAPLPLPEDLPEERRVIAFPGSTIGNLETDERAKLFRVFADEAGPGGRMLLGFDLVKPIDVLEAAYDDRAGVTAAFTLNLLTRINRELGTDFDTARFKHRSKWNPDMSRVELHVHALEAQEVEIGGAAISFDKDESIHVESSHKFTLETMSDEVRHAGFELERHWTDDKNWFCVALFRKSS